MGGGSSQEPVFAALKNPVHGLDYRYVMALDTWGWCSTVISPAHFLSIKGHFKETYLNICNSVKIAYFEYLEVKFKI